MKKKDKGEQGSDEESHFSGFCNKIYDIIFGYRMRVADAVLEEKNDSILVC